VCVWWCNSAAIVWVPIPPVAGCTDDDELSEGLSDVQRNGLDALGILRASAGPVGPAPPVKHILKLRSASACLAISKTCLYRSAALKFVRIWINGGGRMVADQWWQG